MHLPNAPNPKRLNHKVALTEAPNPLNAGPRTLITFSNSLTPKHPTTPKPDTLNPKPANDSSLFHKG